MKRIKKCSFLLYGLLVVGFFNACTGLRTDRELRIVDCELLSARPLIFPDYTDVTVPSTIAPLNFRLANRNYEMVHVNVKGGKSGEFSLQSASEVRFHDKEWKKILGENVGDKIELTLSVKSGGRWEQYSSFPIYISSYPIDYGLTYRLVVPGYEVYSKMGIYERELSNFRERALIENTVVPGSCINCHAYNQCNPDNMSLHVRGVHGGTFLRGGSGKGLVLLDTKAPESLSSFVYPYWHPSGRFVAYSVNKTLQMFHAAKDKLIEVLDLASDIVVYDVRENKSLSSSLLSSSDFETFPSFSPDGRSLYFCRASSQSVPENYKQIRYNLCRIDFDPESGVFGQHIDTLINADALGKSISFPRPSFDGRYIIYTLLDYGNFGIWHQEADLYLLNLSDGSMRELCEINSPAAESYHNWSSNSRWLVFGSRRIDGLYTHPYIVSVDEDGHVGKPFLLPQPSADFYEDSFYSYNIPEFVTKPVSFDANEAANMLMAPGRMRINGK
ncbi:MAG: hypothetical protein LBH04_11060 [Tannerellaceae bacterium]|jgi:hypothetical protein|nr:hypothetical protein [Tannerellaceae bacterium]